MLLRIAAVTALLWALALSGVAAQQAWATGPGAPIPLPAGEPTATPPAAGAGDEDMTGMDHATMPGMEHGEDDHGEDDHDTSPAAEDHATAEPAPTDAPDPADAEHSGGHDPSTPAGTGQQAEEGESHGGHGDDETVTEPRPAAAMVGGFAAVNGAVMVTAAILRRRDKRTAGRSPRSSKPAPTA